MTDQSFDPQRFFDAFPRFIDTSETGPWLERLNARYVALIQSNRELLTGASVLDLASHDGRFSYAALRSGAARVVGIEHEPRLVVKSRENMEFYNVPSRQYDFVSGDMFTAIENVERCDVVFCFGILYHINDHMLLLSKIAAAEPRFLIIDTNVSEMDGAVIELRSGVGVTPPPNGSHIEGRPSKAALDAMLSYFGWTFEYFDWRGSGLTDAKHLSDYQAGRRVSVVVTCNERKVPPDVREDAVRWVFERQQEYPSQWRAIRDAAPKFGMSPEALRFWVTQTERERGVQPRPRRAPSGQ
jgi:hypothetical protein